MTGIVMFGGLLVFMFLGLPVCFSILTACLAYIIPAGVPLNILAQRLVAGMNSFVLLAIPLFTLTGYIMENKGNIK